MGKKVVKAQQAQAKEDKAQEVKATEAQEVKAEAKATAKVVVKALQFLRKLHIDWVLERGLEPGDLDALRAKVKAGEDGTEWASWWMEYTRVDGSPVKGLAWSVAAPMAGRYLVLRLVEDRVVKATMRVWPTGKGVISGTPAIVRALASRPDLPEWTEDDTASLL